MGTGQHFLNFNCTYACKKDASGNIHFFACVYQGPNPSPYGMRKLQQFLSEQSGEAVDLYNIDPFKIAMTLDVPMNEIVDIYMDEEAKRIVENLESLK